VQFACGMIYGPVACVITGTIGTAIGTAVSFYLARLLGRRVITLFLSEKAIAKAEGMLAGTTSTLVLLVLYFLPSPKDFFTYFIGLTNMKAPRYFLISAVGRIPAMLSIALMSYNLLDKPNYLLIGAVAVFSVVVFSLLVVFKDRLLRLAARREEKKAARSR